MKFFINKIENNFILKVLKFAFFSVHSGGSTFEMDKLGGSAT